MSLITYFNIILSSVLILLFLATVFAKKRKAKELDKGFIFLEDMETWLSRSFGDGREGSIVVFSAMRSRKFLQFVMSDQDKILWDIPLANASKEDISILENIVLDEQLKKTTGTDDRGQWMRIEVSVSLQTLLIPFLPHLNILTDEVFHFERID